MHGLPLPRQLRPVCEQSTCNYTQDTVGCVGQQWPNKPTPSRPTPTRSPLELGSPSSRGKAGAGCDEPTPTPPPPPPPLPPSYSNSLSYHPMPPGAERMDREGEETRQGPTDEQREVIGHARLRSPKTVQSAKGEKGKPGKNQCGSYKPLSGKWTSRCTPQRALVFDLLSAGTSFGSVNGALG